MLISTTEQKEEYMFFLMKDLSQSYDYQKKQTKQIYDMNFLLLKNRENLYIAGKKIINKICDFEEKNNSDLTDLKVFISENLSKVINEFFKEI